jgi:signal transduction histidine kinase/CheY-like chemotaxis protein
MFKKTGQYLFRSPLEIGLDNYLVLLFSFISAFIGIFGTIINIVLRLSIFTIMCTVSITVVFGLVYYIAWKRGKYLMSKYAIIIIGIILLNIQWFINYGSTGPILYMFVVIESFIIVFFPKKEKLYLTILLFTDVTVLFFIEYRYPSLIGEYSSNNTRLGDLYTGLLMYLALSILLLNNAMKYYINQKEKAQLADMLKTAFLANMSHEIRTPMNGILGFAEILKEQDLTGDERLECISIIEKSGQRMLTIINNIIDISKIESGLMKLDIQPLNINDQIKDIYTFFKPETDGKGIKLSYLNSLQDSDAIVNTDNEKLYAILMNLVKNAIKYTHSGTIEFGYIRKTDSETEVLEYFVRDTGIGIPEDRLDAIFERFIQADINDRQAYQGAGLGLSISKAYIEMLKGKITVESEIDKGTVFYFTIPYTRDNLRKEKNIHTEPSPDRIKNLKVLIVEDDEASEILLTREVRTYCGEILKVKSGTEAIEVCIKNPDIDLILMDIQLPGKNGYEATMEIRKFNKDVVIIAQTAYALTGDREKALLAGCNDYLSKPINNAALRSMINVHFNKQ